MRGSTWNSVKPLLKALQEGFPGKINISYIIKPDNFWQKQRTNFGSNKFSFEVSIQCDTLMIFWLQFLIFLVGSQKFLVSNPTYCAIVDLESLRFESQDWNNQINQMKHRYHFHTINYNQGSSDGIVDQLKNRDPIMSARFFPPYATPHPDQVTWRTVNPGYLAWSIVTPQNSGDFCPVEPWLSPSGWSVDIYLYKLCVLFFNNFFLEN